MFQKSDLWIVRLVGWSLALLIASGIWNAAKADTTESLVLQAFQSIPEHRHEYAGAVIQHSDGSLAITEPSKATETSFRLHVTLLAGDKLLAIYHSHPGREIESQVFSTDDIEIADKLHVDSFVFFEKTQELRVYHPNITPVSTLNTEHHEKTAIGDKVS